MKETINRLAKLVSKLNRENASDRDIVELNNIIGDLNYFAHNVQVKHDCFYYAGYVAGWNDHLSNKHHMTAEASLKEFKESLDKVEMAMQSPIPDNAPLMLQYNPEVVHQSTPGISDNNTGFYDNSTITLVDLDTRDRMEIEEKYIAAGCPSPVKDTKAQISHTELGEFTDRLAKLEKDVVALHKSMGERIRELAQAKAVFR